MRSKIRVGDTVTIKNDQPCGILKCGERGVVVDVKTSAVTVRFDRIHAVYQFGPARLPLLEPVGARTVD